MREVTASAPGKVNLTLRCGAPADDGYHPLTTVFECVDLRETVTVRTARTRGITVETIARHTDGTVDEQATERLRALPADQHLAVRAAKALQKLAAAGPWGRDAAGLAIEVDKRVPVAGGMAGGSADAAAALVACNALWELGLDLDQLQAVGRTLGADVPACLVGGIALGTGRGDRMRSLMGDPGIDADPVAHNWVVLLADEGLSTPAVFNHLDELGGPGRPGWSDLTAPTADDVARLKGPATAVARVLVNDLQEAAIDMRPEIGETLNAATDAGAVAAILSGSGPTIAALANDAAHAHRLAEVLTGIPHVRATIATDGPAQGARIEKTEAI